MPKYYELDVICEVFSDILHISERDIEEILDKAPTEDVVPRSEYEKMQRTAEHQQSLAMERWFENNRLKRKIDEIEKEVEKAKQEVEKLSIELEAMRGAANSYKMHYEKAKQEVAKEIFEELEKLIISRMIKDVPLIDDRLISDIAELQKKYIGE